MDVRRGPCQVGGRVCFSREISTTYREKNKLLEDACEVIGRYLIQNEAELFRIRLSIDEGLQNAFSHGNGDDPQKRIRLIVFERDDGWVVMINDEGDGFLPEDLTDPTTPAGLWREHGRGVLLMCHYMDEVCYFDAGRTLCLVKRSESKGVATRHEADTHPHERQE